MEVKRRESETESVPSFLEVVQVSSSSRRRSNVYHNRGGTPYNKTRNVELTTVVIALSYKFIAIFLGSLE